MWSEAELSKTIIDKIWTSSDWCPMASHSQQGCQFIHGYCPKSCESDPSNAAWLDLAVDATKCFMAADTADFVSLNLFNPQPLCSYQCTFPNSCIIYHGKVLLCPLCWNVGPKWTHTAAIWLCGIWNLFLSCSLMTSEEEVRVATMIFLLFTINVYTLPDSLWFR